MSKVIDKDLGYERILQTLLDSNQSIDVGLFADDARKTHSRSKNTYAEIVVVNEYGSGAIPERSFMRSTIDKNVIRYSRMVRKAIKRTTGRHSRIPLERLFEVIGMRIRDDIRHTIRTQNDPINAEGTANRKGFNDPLVETGTLQKLIKSRVLHHKVSRYRLRKGRK